MTLLGLPWWAWLPIALSAWLLDFGVATGGQIARHRHTLTCRVYWQLRTITHACAVVCGSVLMVVLWGTVLGSAFIAWDIAAATLAIWRAWRHGQPFPSRNLPLEHPELGTVPVVQFYYVAGTVREAWRHRTHDDDCEHGPTKRWHGSPARLQTWRKVALNPDFTPA